MIANNVSFKNKHGEMLAGRLELPPDQQAHNYAIFAHCFTCTKNLTAIAQISRGLTQAGFGVLRFDFTGLGESEGDFADTNFSGNVDDLEAAADFLEKEYGVPTLIIGHSLGGTAALFAAADISYIRAVAVIAAPSEPSHVKNLIKSDLDEIEKEGKARVQLEGREFTIKKQFVDDLMNTSLQEVIKNLRKPLLIFHSPQDKIVGIENAEKIYTDAFHPKSFISLDGANHLLTDKKDSMYVGRVTAEWAARYLSMPVEEKIKSESKVAASLDGDEKFTTYMKLGNHSFMADEPERFGGNDYGPSPYEYLSGALAACTAMTIQMYAQRKKWDVQQVTVHTDHDKKHALDCENCDERDAKIDHFTRRIALEGALTEEQKNRLVEIAEKCPVHKTLSGEIEIITELAK